MKRIVGYGDRLSVAPGETIRFMVSCDGPSTFRADIVQLICGDLNPDGPGFKEKAVDTPVSGTYPGRVQRTHAGSYVSVEHRPLFAALQSFTVAAIIWPTAPDKGQPQGLITKWDNKRRSGFDFQVDASGCLALVLGDGQGQVETISSGRPLRACHWYLAAAIYDCDSKRVELVQQPLVEDPWADDASQTDHSVTLTEIGSHDGPLLFAAHGAGWEDGRMITGGHYDGKIDSPRLASHALSKSDLGALFCNPIPLHIRSALVGAWDFSRDIPSTVARDLSGNRLDGDVVNLPMRGCVGYKWTGEEMNWRHASEQYGAIHFHEDDIYDAGWTPDFHLTIPEGLRSGVYAARLRDGEDEDYIPFFVRPKPGTATAPIAFLVPTASYMAYANLQTGIDGQHAEPTAGRAVVLTPEDLYLHEHRELGYSLYDRHSDGSGVCYSSRLRPILHLRPSQALWVGGTGSALWQFSADLHLVDWLEARGYAYDVITDEDLDREGYSLLAPYRVVVTGTHPEYVSTHMLDGIIDYTRRGGRLMYLGGNGFYWRTAFHPTLPGVIEVRRTEDGGRNFPVEPGESYHSFTGEYGGLWRRIGRSPQSVVGVGFAAEGHDSGSGYRRRQDSHDPRVAFIFEGIGEDEVIGDFGLICGGAAGLEIDRADVALGTPAHALVVASSGGHSSNYILAKEEMLSTIPNVTGPENDMIRADMVFFEMPGGGAVFSTGSMTWCASLAPNNYRNNVSRITANVLDRFLLQEPF